MMPGQATLVRELQFRFEMGPVGCRQSSGPGPMEFLAIVLAFRCGCEMASALSMQTRRDS